jgi:hypothetical protein
VTDEHGDATIGAYLAGEFPPPEQKAFEQHLLTCDHCWTDVDVGRRGRALVEQAREPAPDHLRTCIHAAAAAHRPTRRPRTRVVVAAALALVTAVTVGVAVRTADPASQPPQITLAVAGYRADRLPGSGIPAQAGPDLSALHLAETGAGSGRLAGQPVTGYAYRDQTGRRILLYLSDRPFPMPERADHPTGPDGAATVRHRGISVLCSRRPYQALVLGDDTHLVWRVAGELDLT